MEEKFKAGLANEVMSEFENIKNLRLSFIAAGADRDVVGLLEEQMKTLFSLYLDLSK